MVLACVTVSACVLVLAYVMVLPCVLVSACVLVLVYVMVLPCVFGPKSIYFLAKNPPPPFRTKISVEKELRIWGVPPPPKFYHIPESLSNIGRIDTPTVTRWAQSLYFLQ